MQDRSKILKPWKLLQNLHYCSPAKSAYSPSWMNTKTSAL